jgi:CRP/FNR family cyclic AMP-dependent transcriptional regulator
MGKKEPHVPSVISAVPASTKHAGLRRLKLFSGLSDGDLDCVVALTTPREVPAGTVLAWQGEEGRQFMIIEQGEARVTMDGNEVARLGPGDFFGELALLDGNPRIATITATTAVRLHVATAGEFHMLLMSVPSLTRQILVTTAARLRRTLQDSVARRPPLSRPGF